MPHHVAIDDDLRKCLLNPASIPSKIEVKSKTYTVEAPVAAGERGVVWRVIDEFTRKRAVKLAISENYEDRSYLEEATRATLLEDYKDCFATFIDVGIAEVALEGYPNQRFVCFIEEWVEGTTLANYLAEHKNEITVSFFLGYVRALCKALSALNAVELRHDDLHTKNVMIVPPPKGALSFEGIVKIVDTGSLKLAGTPNTKAKDDHRHFVEHLVEIWNCVHDKRLLSIRDRRFLSEAQRLLSLMLDDDLVIALRDPAQILEQFNHAYTRSNSLRKEQKDALASPFEYISAEHIADDSLLVSIFAKSCPWLERVASPDPCLVTGPRGCGKSTIFRWLSLKAHLHKSPNEIVYLKDFRIAGFYLSCSTDLQNRIGWIKSDASSERFRREIIHYFNLLAAREVVHTLALIADREDRETFWGFGLSEEIQVYQFMIKALGSSMPLRLQGVPRLVQVRECIEAEMFNTHSHMLRALTPSYLTPETFLGDLTTRLSELISFFKEKRITFLVDDYSVHRIPQVVQKVLNRIIWERRGTHVFKLSSEKYGAFLTDSADASIDIMREMLEIDCGKEYISLDDTENKKALEFAAELLNNRLEAANYKGRAETIIGESKWPEGSLGKALAGMPRGDKQSYYQGQGQYHGLKCISQLCSGDVSSLLFIYSKIFEEGGVDRDTQVPVKAAIQDRAIRDVSRKMLEHIRPTFPYGADMFAIVTAFGNLVRNILQFGKWQKNGHPTQCPRIEIDQDTGGVVDTLAPSQRELALELVRRAIFIEMEPGLSRHGNVTTLRWNLRRIFLPAFGAALSKNDAVKEKFDWFKYFLTNPNEACEMALKKWPKEPDGPVNPELPF